MNQIPQQGQPRPPYPPNSNPQGNIPPAYGQPQNFGQQWNTAPNFNNQYPNQPGQQIPPNNTGKKTGKKKKKKSGSLVGWIFFGIFLMIALIIGGGWLGYRAAISARQAEYSRKSKMAAAEQYQMALADIEQGNYQNAKTRLDYVIEIDQNYPGAGETYQRVIMMLFPTASPTPMMTNTPAPTATHDTRGEQEMFDGIQQMMYSQNWEAAIQQIAALRNKDINFRGLEVDGMYYIALRNFGIQQINSGYLENGVYNITLAEALGPIDNNADSMRDAARAYLSGAGFWEIDWNKALEYYSNAAQSFPNLYDRATMLTANQRYAQASFEVANLYIISQDYCGSIPYYDQGMPIVSGDMTYDNVRLTATAAYLECYPPAPTEDPSAAAAPQPESSESSESGYEETWDEGDSGEEEYTEENWEEAEE